MIAIELGKKQLSRGSPLRNVSEIRADSHRAGQMAAEHLLDRGFANLAFCGYQGRIWSERRQEGFCQRLRESQLSCEVYQSSSAGATLAWHREQSQVTAWLRSLAKPVGIMACNDIRGRQVIEACLQAGLRVPDDVAVVGVDEDRLLCDLANPPLSSVALNLEHAGYQAAELLDGLMSGRIRQPQRIMVDALWVTPRRSTDVVAIEDRHVAAAARFIRDHFRQAITVDDVVAQAGCSRRTLEIRFQRGLGRSIRQEIQRLRLAWAKRLAMETNLSTEKIAEVSGFSSLSYLGSVFRREFGLTLSEFRRQSRNPLTGRMGRALSVVPARKRLARAQCLERDAQFWLDFCPAGCGILNIGWSVSDICWEELSKMTGSSTADAAAKAGQGNILIALNMEYIRNADKPFKWGVEKAAELGYEYVEPMLHLGRQMLAEGGFFHSLSMLDDPYDVRRMCENAGVRS